MKYFIFNIYPELTFRTSRSGGSGGQHVNKTESKVEVIFNILDSAILDNDTKQRLVQRLGKKLIAGALTVYAQESRSQAANKEAAVKKLFNILDKALIPAVKRKKSKPSKAALQKRKENKKRQSEKKQSRKKIF
ncbi:MAG TPA: alternative ribosome rescue aminoacyl-tRNA hydrolase ArfB [Flavobacteriales bacterium]|nr:alternative ribosome rescue aminoacyl-tRNA hydrolase ArfB [Flavobacteriales bacterium]